MKLTSFTNLVFFYASVRLLVDGAEEFLIQPTAWYYVRYLGQSDLYLGFLLAAFSLGALIFAPCIGAVDSRFNASKTILLMCGVVKFLGNLLYTISVNKYFPLVGRLMSGIGEGTVGVIYGAIAKTTNDNNRARAFLYFEGLYGVGTAVGPMVGSFLTFNLNVLGLEINAGNSPGFILTITWLLLLFLTIFLPSDIAENKSVPVELTINISSSEEETRLLPKESTKKYSNWRVCCVSFVIFQSWFILDVGLFYTPLLAVDCIGLGLLEIKLIYANGALFSFLLFLASYLFSSYFSEKTFVAFGVVSQFIPILIFFYFALSWDSHSIISAYILLMLTVFLSVSFVIFPLASSLLSKETPVNLAAFYQSIAFTLLHLAVVVSRVIAGATFNKIAMKYVCVGLAVGWFVEVTWFLLEYRNLYPTSERK